MTPCTLVGAASPDGPVYRASRLHLRQRCFGLGQPERHVHVTVESNGGGEYSAGLLPLADRGIQRTEAEVADGPGAGACPVPRPGRGPGDSGLRPCSISEGSHRAAISPRRRRAYAWWPRSWCSRASASVRSARACASSRWPVSTCASPRRDDRAPDPYHCHGNGCSIACISSGTASATRPPRVYAACPRPQRSWRNRCGRSVS